jgi:hypothetical protein
MALFTLALLVQVLVLTKGPIGYDRWAASSPANG